MDLVRISALTVPESIPMQGVIARVQILRRSNPLPSKWRLMLTGRVNGQDVV